MQNETGALNFAEVARLLGNKSLVDVLLRRACSCAFLLNDFEQDPESLGCSKMGGLPDLPEDIAWPVADDRDGEFAEFLMQINFADVPPIDAYDLPETGHMWVFIASSDDGTLPKVILLRDGRSMIDPHSYCGRA